MIIWPTLQFSLSSCTTTSRPVRRTDSSIAAAIPRHNRAQVEQIDADLAADLLERFERFLDRVAPGDQGDVGAAVTFARDAERDGADGLRSIRVPPRADASG